MSHIVNPSEVGAVPVHGSSGTSVRRFYCVGAVVAGGLMVGSVDGLGTLSVKVV